MSSASILAMLHQTLDPKIEMTGPVLALEVSVEVEAPET